MVPMAFHFLHHFYCTLQDLLEPDKGYIKDDKVTLQVHVIADAPHGVR